MIYLLDVIDKQFLLKIIKKFNLRGSKNEK